MAEKPNVPHDHEPTDAELAAARGVFERKAKAEAERLAAAAAPLKELTAMEGFSTLLDKATELRDTFVAGTPLYAHLNAMVVGMTAVAASVA